MLLFPQAVAFPSAEPPGEHRWLWRSGENQQNEGEMLLPSPRFLHIHLALRHAQLPPVGIGRQRSVGVECGRISIPVLSPEAWWCPQSFTSTDFKAFFAAKPRGGGVSAVLARGHPSPARGPALPELDRSEVATFYRGWLEREQPPLAGGAVLQTPNPTPQTTNPKL